MKVVITTLIWKRPEIFLIWAVAVKRIIAAFPDVQFNVLVAGSEGRISKRMVEHEGFDYLETPNFPLGQKANLRLEDCKKYNADYVLFLGSDDIMSNKTFAFILDKMKHGYDEIAPMDLFVYNIQTGTFIYSQGYTNERTGERLAIGRAIKTSVLDKMDWNMWSNDTNRSLDGSSKQMLDSYIQKPKYYWLMENGLMIIDIKSKENLNRFAIRENHSILNIKKLKEIEEHYLLLPHGNL